MSYLLKGLTVAYLVGLDFGVSIQQSIVDGNGNTKSLVRSVKHRTPTEPLGTILPDGEVDAASLQQVEQESNTAKAVSELISEDASRTFSSSLAGIQDYAFEAFQTATSVLHMKANTSVYVTCFYYDVDSEAGKKALWMLKNLLLSMKSSLETAEMFILHHPESRRDIQSGAALQKVLSSWPTRAHVIDVGQVEIFLRSTRIWHKIHSSTDRTFWKIMFSNFVLQRLAPQHVLVLDYDVVCNLKNVFIPVGKTPDVLGYALARMPADCDIACSLEDQGSLSEDKARRYNTGFCVYRRSQETLSFLHELTPLMFQVGEDDETPFNLLVRKRKRAKDNGFVSNLPSDVIQTLPDGVTFPSQAALCYHYVESKTVPLHVLNSSWINVLN